MGTNDKFFGAIEEDSNEETQAEINVEAVEEALNNAEEVEVGASVVNESTNQTVTLATAEENLPYTAISYYRDNNTGLYHLVSIGYNPSTGTVGTLELDTNRNAPDRVSIEEEFKIKAALEIFSK